MHALVAVCPSPQSVSAPSSPPTGAQLLVIIIVTTVGTYPQPLPQKLVNGKVIFLLFLHHLSTQAAVVSCAVPSSHAHL